LPLITSGKQESATTVEIFVQFCYKNQGIYRQDLSVACLNGTEDLNAMLHQKKGTLSVIHSPGSGRFLFFVVPGQFSQVLGLGGSRVARKSNFYIPDWTYFHYPGANLANALWKLMRVQQKIKIIHTNQQSNLGGSCQSIFSLSRHYPIAEDNKK